MKTHTQGVHSVSSQSHHDRNQSDQQPNLLMSHAMSNTDLQFFEQMMLKYQDDLQESLMTKRQSVRKEDPIEEIKELYGEIKQQEKNFKKVLEVSLFMIEKNKELFNDNDIVSKEFEALVRNNQVLEDQNNALIEENKRFYEQNKTTQHHVKELEKQIYTLQEELDQKTQMLEEYERNLNESAASDRNTFNSFALHNYQQEISELKNNVHDRNKKLKELDQILIEQSNKYDTEIKKSNKLLNEIRALKEHQKELNEQIDELNAVLDEKDLQLDEYEDRVKELQNELNKKNVVSKQNISRKVTGINNPLAQTQIKLGKTKSQSKSNNGDGSQERNKSPSAYMVSQPVMQMELFGNNPQQDDNEVPKFIRVQSQMENFKQHQRKASCPLIISDKFGTKHEIYDKEFQQRKQLLANSNGKKKASDDKKVAPPPEFYPFNELEQVIEEAQVKLRIPSSLRYQTEYINQVGLKLQSILNNQKINEKHGKVQLAGMAEDQEDDDNENEGEEDSEQRDGFDEMIDEDEDDKILGQEQLNHNTFRPVSILDRGLEINEDDLNYEMNARGTLNNQNYEALNRDTYINGSFADRQSILFENGAGYEQLMESPGDMPRESLYQKGSSSNRNNKNFSSFASRNSIILKENEALQTGSKQSPDKKTMETINEAQEERPKQSTAKKNPNLELNLENDSFALRDSQISGKLPIDTPSFSQRQQMQSKMINNNYPTFIEQEVQLRIKQQEQNQEQSEEIKKEQSGEKRKINSHQKKATDSTNIDISKTNQYSPHTLITAEEIQLGINDSRSNIPYASIASSHYGDNNGVSSYQPYNNSQILQSEQLVNGHHTRIYSNIAPFKEDNKSGNNKDGNSHSGGGGGPHSGDGSSYRSPTQHSRKDPNEEFFMMSLLSYKLNHKEYEKILTIDGKDLYTEVIQLKKPFYEWQRWIEAKLDGIYLDQLYRKKKAAAPAKPQFVTIIVQHNIFIQIEQKSQKLGELNIQMNYF